MKGRDEHIRTKQINNHRTKLASQKKKKKSGKSNRQFEKRKREKLYQMAMSTKSVVCNTLEYCTRIMDNGTQNVRNIHVYWKCHASNMGNKNAKEWFFVACRRVHCTLYIANRSHFTCKHIARLLAWYLVGIIASIILCRGCFFRFSLTYIFGQILFLFAISLFGRWCCWYCCCSWWWWWWWCYSTAFKTVWNC